MKIDTTFAHVTWHNTHSETPFLSCTSVSVFWSLLPPHLSLFSRNVLPPGLVVEHNVVKMGMGGFCFCWLFICLAGVEGRKPEPLCLYLLSFGRLWQAGCFPKTPYRAAVPSVSESHLSPPNLLAPCHPDPSPLPSVVDKINHTTP